MDKYYKNLILCGGTDYYCLVCQEAFILNEHVDKHLRWEKHRKTLKDYEYIPKFRKNFIYKVSDCFYCEICNIVMKSAPEHIKEDGHLALKSSNNILNKHSVIKRSSNGTIKINDAKLTKTEWHSIVSGMCLLCDEKITDASAHFELFDHMVKLIQSEIIHNNNQYFRKVGDEKFYCFTCFTITDSLEAHINIHEHENSVENKCETNPQDNNNNAGSTIMNTLMDLYMDCFDFDVKTNTAICKGCKELVEPDFEPISKHKAIHRLYGYIYKDSGKKRAHLKIFGKNNFIHLNEGGRKGYCSLCNVKLSAHITVFKRHVAGGIHQGHLELKGMIKEKKHEKPLHKMVTCKDFLDTKFGPFRIDNLNLVVINDGICMEQHSFSLMRLVDDLKSVKGLCFACDLMMDVDKLQEHCKSKRHMNIFTASKVLPMKIKGDEEFVRQIRPGLFHCGYCNKVFPYWENTKKHLKSLCHEVQRNKKKLLSIICGKIYLNPMLPLETIQEYNDLKNLDANI